MKKIIFGLMFLLLSGYVWAATPTPTPVYSWSETFTGTPGNTITGWYCSNSAFVYNPAGNMGIAEPRGSGSIFIQSPSFIYNKNVSHFQSWLEFPLSATTYTIAVQQVNPPYTYATLELNRGYSAIWDIDINSCLDSAVFDGTWVSIFVWVNSKVDLKWMRVSNQSYQLANYGSTLMPQITPVTMAHVMSMWGVDRSPTPTWYGYDSMSHNPNVTVTPQITATPGTGKADIAMNFYPVSSFAKPSGTPRPRQFNVEGVYDQRDAKTVDRQLLTMIGAGIGGITLDCSNYYATIGNSLSGNSFSQEVGAQWVREAEAIGYVNGGRFKVVPAYEDKVSWIYADCGSRTATVQAAYQDLNAWMDLFYNASNPDIAYKINGAPVLVFFSYEASSTYGYTRLSAAELATWKSDYATKHSNVAPIIISNIKECRQPAALEIGTSYYSVIDGYFEWPQAFDAAAHTTPTPTGYTFTHNLADEKIFWGGEGCNNNWLIDSGKANVIISGMWTGFDDKAVNGWGVGSRYISFSDGAGNWTLDYHIARARQAGFPLKLVASWNDSAEGANIEPSVEFDDLFSTAPNMPGILWPLNEIRASVAYDLGISPGTNDLWQAYYFTPLPIPITKRGKNKFNRLGWWYVY